MAYAQADPGAQGGGVVARMRFWARGAADLVLPPRCAVCGEATGGHDAVCAACWQGLHFIEPPVCAVLGTPLPAASEPGTLSAPAIAAPPPFACLRAACRYDGSAVPLVRAFKYADRIECARLIARLMARAGGDVLKASDIVVPVPLHWTRMLARRFNQSAEIARRLCGEAAPAAGCTYVPDALRRIRRTRRQVGLKLAERALNVTGAFAVPEHLRHLVAGKRVLMVDDVYTTGATVTAAARALKRAGADDVRVLVFAMRLDDV